MNSKKLAHRDAIITINCVPFFSNLKLDLDEIRRISSEGGREPKAKVVHPTFMRIKRMFSTSVERPNRKVYPSEEPNRLTGEPAQRANKVK